MQRPRPEWRPDATLFPEIMKSGNHALDRYLSLCSVAEHLLQATQSERARYWRLSANNGQVFAVLYDISDKESIERALMATLLFPTFHDLNGRSRYDWYPGQQAGIQLGYLVPRAKEDEEQAKARAKTISILDSVAAIAAARIREAAKNVG